MHKLLVFGIWDLGFRHLEFRCNYNRHIRKKFITFYLHISWKYSYIYVLPKSQIIWDLGRQNAQITSIWDLGFGILAKNTNYNLGFGIWDFGIWDFGIWILNLGGRYIPTWRRNKEDAKQLLGYFPILFAKNEKEKTSPEFKKLVRETFYKSLKFLLDPLFENENGIDYKINNRII
ncbi:hypothetical protein Glove_526g34 [Diversispora epigaea]|uniref:Uncharacterized protein n=1 Tax=Diversispora epigaea TaxID=1348612 RepID=A0A397GMQ8_9GLOM|nr:hypothetical protein Glove_526g34 [Diversispora epigaea]